MEIPAIALDAYRMWKEGGLDLDLLSRRLFELDDPEEAYRAVTALAATALFVEQRGGAAAKEQLLALIQTQAPRLQAVEAIDSTALAEEVTAHLEQLAGPRPPAAKRAPSVKPIVPNPGLRPPPKK